MSRRSIPAVLVLGLLGATLLLNACSEGQGEAAEPADAPQLRPHNVRVLEMETTSLVETVPVSGRLEARQATDVSTEEAGVVKALPIDKGQLVRKGQVVVALDRRLLEAEKNSAESAVTLRKYNEERTRTLFEANSVSKQEMLRVYTELQQATESARIAELRYERAAIKAPFEGMVADHFVEVGQLVNPGQRVARVVDPFMLELVGSVTEREVVHVRVGSPAIVSIDGMDEVLEAEVSYVGVEASPLNGKFEVELRIDNRDLRIRAGVVGRARILKAVHEGVLAIPRDAIVRGPRGDSVFVVENDRAVRRSVVLGADQGMMVVVLEGLASGDRVVVRGQRQIQPDAALAVQEVATARDGSVPTDPAEVREAGNLEGFLDMAATEARTLPIVTETDEGGSR